MKLYRNSWLALGFLPGDEGNHQGCPYSGFRRNDECSDTRWQWYAQQSEDMI